MARFRPVEVIEVLLWGRRVGAVAKDPRRAAYVFEYDRAWRAGGIELAPFTMPLGDATGIFVFPDLDRAAFDGLPGLLADALPDRFGNQLIDAWMAQRGYQPAQVTALDRLAYMGKRGMGALEFRPARAGQGRMAATPIAMASLVEAARRAVEGSLGDEPASARALSQLIAVGTSAAGVRAKAVIGWNPSSGALVSGQFALPAGFEYWLLKFDGMGTDRHLGPSQQCGRIEFAYARMAGIAGVQMTECRLVHENGRAHFMTRRFDREDATKIHVQSLCALRHASHNLTDTHAYETLFLTARALGLGDEAMNQLFRRMAFNVAARNHDDHTRNMAFLMRPGEGWSLAPAFDITFAFDPGNRWLSRHLMSVNGKFEGIGRADLMALAERFSVPGAKQAITDVNQALSEWAGLASDAGVGRAEIERIASLHQAIS